MTKMAQRRLLRVKKCSICKNIIEDYDDIQVIKYRQGKFVEYNFFHTSCLKKARIEIERV